MGLITKAVIQNVDTGEPIEVMFNPKEYILSKRSPWAESSGLGSDLPDVSFAQGGRRSLYMELFFDTSDTESSGSVTDVSETTKKIEELMMVNPSYKNLDGSVGRPPYLLFQWGGFSFPCVLENLVQRFTRFAGDGTPTRAILRVVFKEIKNQS